MVVRRQAYRSGLLPVHRVPVPVIVVGNISVGGTGKTPLVIWIANFLKANNFKPGVVSRGYRGKANRWPQQVRPDSDPTAVGDEPVVIARRCNCPVAVAPDRRVAVDALLDYTDCDVVVCDDGLQHMALGRDIEICVVNGIRRFGNGRCMPAGPLREPLQRIKSVDMVVTTGVGGYGEFPMKVVAGDLVSLEDESEHRPLERFQGHKVHGVAGIANPERFFSILRSSNINVICHGFPDHHSFSERDIRFDDRLPVLMTEKDAVKCKWFAGTDYWYLPVEAQLPAIFEHRLLSEIKGCYDGQEAA